MKKNKKKEVKKRNEYVYARTKSGIDGFTLSVGPNNEIIFGTEIDSAWSEVSFERPKGPKVIHRINQPTKRARFDAHDALADHFDLVCAVDTNTSEIGGRTISVTSVIVIERKDKTEDTHIVWGPKATFGACWLDPSVPPERLGWMFAAEQLHHRGLTQGKDKIAMIVDSDLGKLKAFKDQIEPLFEDVLLPKWLNLEYASSDVGVEYTPNFYIRAADTISREVMRELKENRCPIPQDDQQPYSKGVVVLEYDIETIPEGNAPSARFKDTRKVRMRTSET